MNNPRYSRLTKAILATTVAVTLGQVANAAADVDIDDDGLIEISTLQQLDLMRYDLAGTSLAIAQVVLPLAVTVMSWLMIWTSIPTVTESSMRVMNSGIMGQVGYP